jgi:predicted acylesterase/phospholipase RssA
MTAKTAVGKSKRKIAVTLQDGGALGSNRAGAYEALLKHDYISDWVACISIGAMNGAVIAGSALPQHIEKRAVSGTGFPRRRQFFPACHFLMLSTDSGTRPVSWCLDNPAFSRPCPRDAARETDESIHYTPTPRRVFNPVALP